MPKARLTECLLVLACLPGAGAWAQPVLGQYIDQTKKNKLAELTQPKAADTPGPGPDAAKGSAVAVGKANSDVPVLWSLSGINSRLVAEIWDGQGISRVPALPGQKLPSGWTVASASPHSLTLTRGKAVHTLVPAAPGSTGGEFIQMRKTQGLEALLASLGSDGRSLNGSQPLALQGTQTGAPPLGDALPLPPPSPPRPQPLRPEPGK